MYQYQALEPVSGSPPRVREKLKPSYHLLTRCGITPACAGKTQRPTVQSLTLWDHPRVCGKNSLKNLVIHLLLGSPPRVREKQFYIQIYSNYFGITPACAGKTPYRLQYCTAFWDHPRVCGKNWEWKFHTLTSTGSPPRVREKH